MEGSSTAWIRMVSEGEADLRLSALYDEMVDPRNGRVDHILAVHSLHPEGMASHHSVYKAVMTSTRTLRRVEREMIALVVSRINNCHY
jgi:alkylhydroperoxidase family enzyme